MRREKAARRRAPTNFSARRVCLLLPRPDLGLLPTSVWLELGEELFGMRDVWRFNLSVGLKDRRWLEVFYLRGTRVSLLRGIFGKTRNVYSLHGLEVFNAADWEPSVRL